MGRLISQNSWTLLLLRNQNISKIQSERWDQLGVIEQTGDEVCLSGDFDEVSILNFEHNFPQILRRQILLEKNNPKDQFFGQELNLASDFTRMAAWMMLQQPSKFSLIFRKFDTLQTEMNKQLMWCRRTTQSS